MTIRLRFAPSPTGFIHIGNARTAILNYLYARKKDGQFLLRLDDTDRERSKEEFVEAIRRDLRWLGLNWDREERQSDRLQRYKVVVDKLRSRGRLYACYETAEELERKRRRQLARGLPPIYDRTGLKLTPDEISKLENEGRTPHWRFRLDNAGGPAIQPLPTLVSWNDLVRGDQAVDVGSLSDPVLVRQDGTFLYTLTSVIDDMDFGITHIIRGEDHVTNTGVQIQLFEALDREPPVFGHHSLLVGADGRALSKRLGSLAIEKFRGDGIEAMAVVSHAALIGTSDAIEPHAEMEGLIELFDFSKISTAPARFSGEELRGLNAKLLHTMPFEAVSTRLKDIGVEGDARFWLAVRGNLETLSDAADWWRVVAADVQPVIEDPRLLSDAIALLPPEPWSDETWPMWTSALKSKTGVKGRELFHPLRAALTGKVSGPEMKSLLPLIGRAKAAARLAGEVS